VFPPKLSERDGTRTYIIGWGERDGLDKPINVKIIK